MVAEHVLWSASTYQEGGRHERFPELVGEPPEEAIGAAVTLSCCDEATVVRRNDRDDILNLDRLSDREVGHCEQRVPEV